MTVATESPLLERLRAVLAEVADLYHAQQILEWDARVSMPHAGAEARADVASTVTQLAHGRFVSDEVGKLLDDLDAAGHDPDSVEGALIRLTPARVGAREPDPLGAGRRDGAGERSGGRRVGRRESSSDFESFSPHLERQLELKRRYIACFPETDEPYDVLLDEYEDGLTTAQVEEIFGTPESELVELVERHRGESVDEIAGPYPVSASRTRARWC